MAERCKKTILCSVSHLGFLASGLFAHQLYLRFSRARNQLTKNRCELPDGVSRTLTLDAPEELTVANVSTLKKKAECR
jgi:hypothetical protein